MNMLSGPAVSVESLEHLRRACKDAESDWESIRGPEIEAHRSRTRPRVIRSIRYALAGAFVVGLGSCLHDDRGRNFSGVAYGEGVARHEQRGPRAVAVGARAVR